MKYSKQWMSITELKKIGYPENDLRDYCHAKGCPIRWSVGGGKVFFDMTRFPQWEEQHQETLKQRKNKYIRKWA